MESGHPYPPRATNGNGDSVSDSIGNLLGGN